MDLSLPPKLAAQRSVTTAGRLQQPLLAWFRAEQRALPWRENREAYRLWISEVMLQQTRVETVIGYFERFVTCFPTLEALAKAPLEDVLGIWSGLGYYSRARKLHAAAQEILARFEGEFPRTRAEALSLPGVGPYTAGAVLSIAYGLGEPLVDGNVQRVFARLFALRDEAGSGVLQKKLWGLARELLPREEDCGDWNQALMELGATCCTARTPRCEECPLRAECRALELDLVAELPRPKARKRPTALQLEIFVACEGGRCLLEQRPLTGRMAGLWQFPTLELGPVGVLFPTQFAAGTGPFVRGESLGNLRHSITRYAISAGLHRAHFVGDRPPAWRWFGRAELEGAALTGMTRKVLLRLKTE